MEKSDLYAVNGEKKNPQQGMACSIGHMLCFAQYSGWQVADNVLVKTGTEPDWVFPSMPLHANQTFPLKKSKGKFNEKLNNSKNFLAQKSLKKSLNKLNPIRNS